MVLSMYNRIGKRLRPSALNNSYFFIHRLRLSWLDFFTWLFIALLKFATLWVATQFPHVLLLFPSSHVFVGKKQWKDELVKTKCQFTWSNGNDFTVKWIGNTDWTEVSYASGRNEGTTTACFSLSLKPCDFITQLASRLNEHCWLIPWECWWQLHWPVTFSVCIRLEKWKCLGRRGSWEA